MMAAPAPSKWSIFGLMFLPSCVTDLLVLVYGLCLLLIWLQWTPPAINDHHRRWAYRAAKILHLVWVATLGATVLVATESLPATAESLPIIATATYTAAVAVVELDADAFKVALLIGKITETPQQINKKVEWTAHILQWKGLVGALFLATVAARATVLVILLCNSNISMVTSASIVQAIMIAANLWLLHKLLSFAFSIKSTFLVIISGFSVLMTTLVVSEIVLTILTLHGEAPESTAWKVGYGSAVTVLGWVLLYIGVCMRTGQVFRRAPEISDLEQAPQAAISTQPCAAEPAPSPGAESSCSAGIDVRDSWHTLRAQLADLVGDKMLALPHSDTSLATDAHQAAESAAEPLAPLLVAAFAGSPPDVVEAWQVRRTELTEGASALQRWMVALSQEAARQMEAAKALHALGVQVARKVEEASDLDARERALSQAAAQHREAAEKLEACVACTATDAADARAWHSADVMAAAVAEREAAAQQLGEANARPMLESERRETELVEGRRVLQNFKQLGADERTLMDATTASAQAQLSVQHEDFNRSTEEVKEATEQLAEHSAELDAQREMLNTEEERLASGRQRP